MPKKQASILIRHGDVLTLNSNREILKDGAIAIVGEKIADVGPDARLAKKWTGKEDLDATGKAVMPGFINTHAHAIQSLLRGGLSQDRNLYDWVLNALYPGLAQYSGADARTGAMLFAIEAIRYGNTTIVDNADWGMVDEIAESTIETYQDCGIRAVYARMFADHEPTDDGPLMAVLQNKEPGVKHPRFTEDTSDALGSIDRLMKKHHGSAGGRISVCPAPATPAFNTPEGMRGSLELAEKYDTVFSLHIVEDRIDGEIYGMNIGEYLAAVGILHPRLVAGHCVWLDDKGLRLFKRFDAKVAHLPVSNLYLASGIAPVAKMISMGITVGLGTDDANCNDAANMIAEMKHAALLQKMNNWDSGAITAEKVIEMATIDSARTVGMEDQLGSIQKGKIADIILIDLESPHLKPCHQIAAVLVYQADGSEVDTTIVNGKILMTGGKLTFLSEEQEKKVMDEAQAASARIAEAAGMGWAKERGWRTVGT